MKTPEAPAAEAEKPRPITAADRLSVRFISRWQNYYSGDVATFPARMAAGLVARGKAERVNIVQDPNPPPGAEWALRRPGNHVTKQQRLEDDLDVF